MKLRPKKSLGQHFLNSKSALEKIIAAGNIQPSETLLEIGPGTGILTKALLKKGAHVLAIEKDGRSIAPLREKFAAECATGQLKLLEEDILTFDRRAHGLEEGKYAVIANIPYYITGAILEKYLAQTPRPNRMVLLVQKEVAERIVARGGKESLLSISVKSFGAPRIVAKVPRGAFIPPPEVDSAILAISDISNRQFKDSFVNIEKFFEVVRAGFAHKRKFLIRNLEDVAAAEKLERAWVDLGLNNKVRAEDISPAKWFAIMAACTGRE